MGELLDTPGYYSSIVMVIFRITPSNFVVAAYFRRLRKPRD